MSRRRSASSSIRRRIYIITVFAIYIVCIFSLFSLLLAVDSDLNQQQQQQLEHQIQIHDDETSNNSSRKAREGSFAGMIDRALEKEFTEGDQTQGPLPTDLSVFYIFIFVTNYSVCVCARACFTRNLDVLM